ncbi:MAG: PspC domain-containing protein [Gammaproteobacteria bacterium]|nr:PspC domain-containing protein [Gammaproteobacteria bacterium]
MTWALNLDALVSEAARLYRDRDQGWLFGVCAGLAVRLGVDALLVRVVAAGLLVLLPWTVGPVYLVLGLTLKDRPLAHPSAVREREFWARHRHGRDGE